MIPLFAQSQIMIRDEELKFYRVTSTTYTDGLPVHNKELTFSMFCNVQPMNARDLLLVPEGDRHREQYTIFTENRNQEPRLQANDRVVRLGKNFQIQSVEAWGSYVKARIMLDDVGPASKGET